LKVAANCQLPLVGSVLGVDIGYSEIQRSSAVCRLDWDAANVDFGIERFRAVEPERSNVLNRFANRGLLAAAFDGPLRGDLEVIGKYRLAEQLLTLRIQPFIGKPGQSSSPNGKHLNAAANACAKIVLRTGTVAKSKHIHAIHEVAIVEAFPTSFLGLMVDDPIGLKAKRPPKSDRFYDYLSKSGGLDRLLSYFLPNRKPVTPFADVKNHDDRAAVVCALTALCIAANEYTAVGDGQGWIILPPPHFIRSYAWTKLCENAKCNGGLEWQSRDLPTLNSTEI
jgi:hypothetical protein